MKTMKFKDPMVDQELIFKMIPTVRLVPTPYQREMSTLLVKRLTMSIIKGFVVPIVVTPVPGKNQFFVIDGQHRLEAVQAISTQTLEIPCIVVPEDLMNFVMLYNIEKTDNIKDKATKVYNLYTSMLEEGGHMEDDLCRYISYEGHLIPIAFSYMENELKSPSLIETTVKKFNCEPIDGKIEDVKIIRQTEAKIIRRLEETVNEICDDCGIKDFNLKKSIISQTNMRLWGRKHMKEVGIGEGIEHVIGTIQDADWSHLAKF
jgi:hypothetical protein